MVMPKMYVLADENYANKHTYFVDGSPTVIDAYFGGAWHTVLVAGLNGGGRGYYALDITNPSSPLPLWEFCDDDTLCTWGDTDLGFTYGNPIITKIPVAIGRVGWRRGGAPHLRLQQPGRAPGPDGKGYLYVRELETGKLSTSSAPGGGAAWAHGHAERPLQDHGACEQLRRRQHRPRVYGGDLLGNVWKWDLTAPAAATKIAQYGRPDAADHDEGGDHPHRQRLRAVRGHRLLSWRRRPRDDRILRRCTRSRTRSPTSALARGEHRLQHRHARGHDGHDRQDDAVDWTTDLGWRVDLPQPGRARQHRSPADPGLPDRREQRARYRTRAPRGARASSTPSTT